jgi:CheY-like chemotaxis protein
VPGLRIVLAEDAALLREGLVGILERAGHEVVAAVPDADALLAHTAHAAPDVVVTDIRMPRGGGRELIANLRSGDADLPIVVMTGYMSLNDEEGITVNDRMVVLQKPIEIERLLQIIKDFTANQAPAVTPQAERSRDRD